MGEKTIKRCLKKLVMDPCDVGGKHIDTVDYPRSPDEDVPLFIYAKLCLSKMVSRCLNEISFAVPRSPTSKKMYPCLPVSYCYGYG